MYMYMHIHGMCLWVRAYYRSTYSVGVCILCCMWSHISQDVCAARFAVNQILDPTPALSSSLAEAAAEHHAPIVIEASVAIAETAIVDNASSVGDVAAPVGDVAATVGDGAAAPVGDVVAAAPVGDVAAAPVGDVAAAPVGDVAAAPVGDVAVAPVGDVAAAPVGDVASIDAAAPVESAAPSGEIGGGDAPVSLIPAVTLTPSE